MSTRTSSLILTLATILMGSLCGLSQSTTRNLQTLRGSVHPLAAVSTDKGPLPDSKPLPNLKIYIAPTPAQKVALQKLLVDQRTPGSPAYHKWLTPEQFGERFGLSTSDEAKMRSWLNAQGFTGINLSRARNVFTFSSTVGQVSSVFHTSIHALAYKGQQHFANTSAIALPRSVSDLVLAVTGLNDFHPTPQHVVESSQARPQFSDPSHNIYAFAPGDIALQYDINRLYNSGFDGSGITAVVIGQSEIDVNDIRAYRAAFNLPPNDPKTLLVPGGTDLGHVNPSEMEADLDLEVLGAVARGANLLYVYEGDSNNALQYAIDQNLGSVISFSYGGAEYLGETWGGQQATWELLAQQGNAQGITIVVASGDTGAAEGDQRAPATNGMVVDWPADIPEVTAVGGTSLPYDSNGGISYLYSTSSDPYGTSLLAPTPEVTWNASMAPSSLGVGSLLSSGGGKSLVYPKPSWQQGPGVPADGARDVPDVSMFSQNNGSGYVVCVEGDCQPGVVPNGISTGGMVIGGTSASTPVFAGVVALVNQYLLKTGVISSPGLGNINPNLYQLAIDAPDAFHDVTQGDNKVPCQIGSPDCTSIAGASYGEEGYDAGPGYDLATGLGSVDAYNLAYDWSKYSPAATTLTLTANPQPIEGQDTTLTAKVAAGNGTPSGTVSFYDVAYMSNVTELVGTAPVGSDGVATLDAGAVPSYAAEYYAEYSGATGYTQSVAGPVMVVTPTTTTLSASATQVNLGAALTLTANVTSTYTGVPTGTVTFAEGSTTLGTATLSGGQGSISISTLTAGSHSITAAYQPTAGSTNGTSASAAITVTVNAPDFTLTATPTSLSVNGGSTASTTLSIAPLYGFSGPAPTTSCSGLPSGANCVFGTPAVQSDGSTSIPLSITTATTTANAQGTQSGSGLFLAFLPLLFWLGRRRKALVRVLSSFALFACLIAIGLGASGCGSGSAVGSNGGNTPPTPTPTVSTVTVTASSAGITHQVKITLTVD